MAEDMLVVGSKVKAYIKSKGCHTSGDALAALNEHVHGIIDGAVRRCQGNKRSTVKPQDM
ncbi:hypothetical protein HQ544_01465 [Candidatus Falkowbacteria bacterium]|nr:hypothetical protein [Candidatus Falkowbacteria bacterium]